MSLDNVKHIVLVLSGKGGVGKSSITTQLALSLSLAGHSVGILDIDLTGPSIPRLLGLENAKITQAPGGWLPSEVHPPQTLPPIPNPPTSETQTRNSGAAAAIATPSADRSDNNTNGDMATLPDPAENASRDERRRVGSLHAISLALLLPSRSSAVVWRGPKKTAMVRQFLTEVLWPPSTDYLLIDTPPGTSDEHISLAETLRLRSRPAQLAGAVVVTTPQAVAVSDVRKEVNFCRKVGVEVLGVVENMSGYVCECCGEGTNLFGKGGGEAMAGSFGVPFLGGVPVDRQWGVLVEEGTRPSYGVVEKSAEGEGEEMGEGEGEEGTVTDQAFVTDEDGVEAGLLIDRYRSCSLCGVFEGITKQLVDIVEGRSNVAV